MRLPWDSLYRSAVFEINMKLQSADIYVSSAHKGFLEDHRIADLPVSRRDVPLQLTTALFRQLMGFLIRTQVTFK